MNVTVPSALVTLTLTKISTRYRYDIPGYESGGLVWCDTADVSRYKDSYLVTKGGKVLGLVYECDGEWTSQKVCDVTLPEGSTAHAFSSRLYTGETCREAVAKLALFTKEN